MFLESRTELNTPCGQTAFLSFPPEDAGFFFRPFKRADLNINLDLVLFYSIYMCVYAIYMYIYAYIHAVCFHLSVYTFIFFCLGT